MLPFGYLMDASTVNCTVLVWKDSVRSAKVHTTPCVCPCKKSFYLLCFYILFGAQREDVDV